MLASARDNCPGMHALPINVCTADAALEHNHGKEQRRIPNSLLQTGNARRRDQKTTCNKIQEPSQDMHDLGLIQKRIHSVRHCSVARVVACNELRSMDCKKIEENV
jgi:hypothetical protein